MSNIWAELQLKTPRDLIDDISSLLFEHGALGLQEDYLPGQAPPPPQPWDTLPPPPPPPFALLKVWFDLDSQQDITALLAEKVLSHDLTVQWSEISASDWGESWKANFSRHVFSDELAIAPPWLAQQGDLIVEPGVAFGTGEHPTTASCLEAISKWRNPGASCLDVGCGSGILALAAAKLGMKAVGIDIDPDAVSSANETAKQNNLKADFSTLPLQRIDGKYELVVANLFAELLIQFAPLIMARCSHRLALAGILIDRVDGVYTAYESMTLIRSKQEGDWVSLWYEI